MGAFDRTAFAATSFPSRRRSHAPLQAPCPGRPRGHHGHEHRRQEIADIADAIDRGKPTASREVRGNAQGPSSKRSGRRARRAQSSCEERGRLCGKGGPTRARTARFGSASPKESWSRTIAKRRPGQRMVSSAEGRASDWAIWCHMKSFTRLRCACFEDSGSYKPKPRNSSASQ